ncbi:MAG: acyl-CoA thioesterase [Bacteroidota bacterium]|nr:acyl-CoA thioesterase [Bacteroidota bacterium]MDX5426876.1 acyl-CoA thioesterase [Bacteroidota bacterium]MDX5448554.1 acyl-CoA thioesterase [Bacteroidota bacterium]MDX5504870.1 acyl-CoA thioesterase [Bacteroidota bacterium]
MFSSTTTVRVRYAETDQMGVVYYGNYATFFEVGRVEALRVLGHTYKQMEEDGVMLPVLRLECKYIRSAVYDDLLTVRTEIREMPGTRITFHHEILNEKGELLTTGMVQLVFLDIKTRRPIQAPEGFKELFKPYF